MYRKDTGRYNRSAGSIGCSGFALVFAFIGRIGTEVLQVGKSAGNLRHIDDIRSIRRVDNFRDATEFNKHIDELRKAQRAKNRPQKFEQHGVHQVIKAADLSKDAYHLTEPHLLDTVTID
jgi:hypothetical protein